MKITFVLPFAGLAGGIRVVAIYAQKLQERGHEVVIVSTPKRRPSFKQKLKHLVKSGQWLQQPHEPSHFDGLDLDHRVLDTCRPVTDTDIPASDVVIATYWTTAECVNNLSVSKGEKIYFIQGKEADFPGLPAERVKQTYHFPFKIITISKSLRDWVYGINKRDDISLIFNSVDTSLFSAPARKKQTIPTVGMLYSPTHIKGCDVTLKALEKIRDKHPAARLLAFGAQPLEKNLPLPENSEYHLSPPQKKIADIYSQCDVWLCGSRMEGFHLPPLEAMACRCPVVSTEVGGPQDLIQEGKNGYIVPLEDYNQLAEAACRILSLSNEEWCVMSNYAYQTAHAYTWDDAADLFEQSLMEAIKS